MSGLVTYNKCTIPSRSSLQSIETFAFSLQETNMHPTNDNGRLPVSEFGVSSSPTPKRHLLSRRTQVPLPKNIMIASTRFLTKTGFPRVAMMFQPLGIAVAGSPRLLPSVLFLLLACTRSAGPSLAAAYIKPTTFPTGSDPALSQPPGFLSPTFRHASEGYEQLSGGGSSWQVSSALGWSNELSLKAKSQGECGESTGVCYHHDVTANFSLPLSHPPSLSLSLPLSY